MPECTLCEINKDDIEFKVGKRMVRQCRNCRNSKRREARIKYIEIADNITKICNKCNVNKSGKEFEYLSNSCKQCISYINSDTNNRPTPDTPDKNCNTCNLLKSGLQFRFRSNICKECEKKKLYEWRKNNPDAFKKICKSYRDKPDYREKQNIYKRKVYNATEIAKLQKQFINRCRALMKESATKPTTKGRQKYENMLGCTFETYREWISSNFTENMTWDNYGIYWHIDHTRPCSSFDFNLEEDWKECFHWSNLYPLPGIENLSKSAKVDYNYINEIRTLAYNYYKQQPYKFRTETESEILFYTVLENESDNVSEVLDTKVSVKAETGSG